MHKELGLWQRIKLVYRYFILNRDIIAMYCLHCKSNRIRITGELLGKNESRQSYRCLKCNSVCDNHEIWRRESDLIE